MCDEAIGAPSIFKFTRNAAAVARNAAAVARMFPTLDLIYIAPSMLKIYSNDDFITSE